MPFILASSYQFTASKSGRTLVQLGLNSKNSFEPSILFNDSKGNTLLLNFPTYVEVFKLLEQNHFFFASDSAIVLLSHFPSKFVNKFLFQFDVINQIITVELDQQILFTINTGFWYELCLYRDIFSLKLTLLSKYALYAKVLYSRFVSFLINQTSVPSSNLLMCAPTSLIPEHKYLEVDFSDYDTSLCQLLDAEIRHYCIDEIIRESTSACDNESYTHNSFHTKI